MHGVYTCLESKPRSLSNHAPKSAISSSSPTQVHRWLGKVFGGGAEVPEYEVSSATVDQLHRLARENERKEREAELAMEDMRQATEEYCSESMSVFIRYTFYAYSCYR